MSRVINLGVEITFDEVFARDTALRNRKVTGPRPVATNVGTGVTGSVSETETGLTTPITVTLDSGASEITFSASGSKIVASIASSLATDASLSAVARAIQTDGAGVLVPFTLTGVTGASGPFDPAAVLFGAGEQGGWYDSSDLTTMFQDSTGTAPVTATGQTVGLLLDKSQGLVLGAELRGTGAVGLIGTATPATYDTNTGAGSVSRVDLGNQSFVSVASLVDGRTYRVQITVLTGTILLRAATPTGVTILTLTAGSSTPLIVPAPALVIATTIGTATFTLESVRELAGNHLTQATAADRPAYGIEPFGGRRNLLVRTEEFENGAWSKTSGSITADSVTAPDGTLTADTLNSNAAATGGPRLTQSPAITGGISYTLSSYFKLLGTNFAFISLRTSGANWAGAEFDLSTGTVNRNVSAGNVAYVGATITSVGDGWYRCTATVTTTDTVAAGFKFFGSSNGTATFVGGFPSFTNVGTETIYVWGAQSETASLATAYQRVTDEFNVTEEGVPSVSYLTFITNKWFISPTITPGIDKAQVFAGARKLNDTVSGIFVEYSASASSNAGAFTMRAPRTADNYSFGSGGTLYREAIASGYVPPITNVVTGLSDIAADTATIRVNGAQIAQNTSDQGTGNFNAYPLYVGRRNGTSLPFNGRLYQLLVRFGANLDADTIAATETFVNSRTGAYV